MKTTPVTLLVLACMLLTPGLSADDWLKEEIERDWLRQEAVRQQGAAAGLTTLFNRSYENLINRQLINNIDVDPRSAYIPAEPPLTFGSHRSKMIDRIRSGQCPVNLTQQEFVRLVTWIDVNAPYYGTYDGKKNLRWKNDPDFRPHPR